MATKNYQSIIGNVQQFGDDPVISERDITVNDEEITVREFTVRSATRNSKGVQNLIRVTAFPELEALEGIVRGALVGVDGNFSQNEGKNGNTFYNITANSISVGTTIGRKASATRAKKTETKKEDLDF